MDSQSRLDDLHRRAEQAGGEARLQRQRNGGRLTARERIDALFDPGSFEEIDKFVTHRCRVAHRGAPLTGTSPPASDRARKASPLNDCTLD